LLFIRAVAAKSFEHKTVARPPETHAPEAARVVALNQDVIRTRPGFGQAAECRFDEALSKRLTNRFRQNHADWRPPLT
jgi:hypothetical protein